MARSVVCQITTANKKKSPQAEQTLQEYFGALRQFSGQQIHPDVVAVYHGPGKAQKSPPWPT